MVSALRLLESGRFCLGQLRPLRGVACKERVAHVTRLNSSCTRTPRLAGSRLSLGVTSKFVRILSRAGLPRPLAPPPINLFVFSCMSVFRCNSEGGKEIYLYPPHMDTAARGAKQECLLQIIQMRRTRGAEPDWPPILGEAARSLGVGPTAPPLSNLRDPAAYLDIFRQTLDSAAFPRKSNHFMALRSDICNESKAWGWICKQIMAGALHPEWIRSHLIGHLGVLFADLFR